MRIMVFGDPEPLRAIYPDHQVVSRQRWAPCRGSAVYVAFEPDHLARYEAWFPGVTVRANARTRDAQLHPGEALYLPVTYDCWLVQTHNADAFPAALEAAHRLAGVQTVVVPELPADARIKPRTHFRHWHDRVTPATT